MLDYELDAQLRCFESGDAVEGIKAFVEKRTPQFGVRQSVDASVRQ
jgi:enoyl-CoA hydratase/carnithine racemase